MSPCGERQPDCSQAAWTGQSWRPRGEAGDGAALASGWLSCVLALEIQDEGGAAEHRPCLARSYPAHEAGKSALGRLTHSRRAFDAQISGGPIDHLEIHDARSKPTVPELADASTHSCRCDRCDWFAGVACHLTIRSHSTCANSGRVAPQIRRDLVSDRNRWSVALRSIRAIQ